jgi:TetR/AcrR family transcriptional regulator, regulator of cefoperazone and chloramphenicol sensitivity
MVLMKNVRPCAPASAQNALPTTGAKYLRSDGAQAKRRLLDAALPLFAEKGFAKTSTREIAQAAQVNIASISYYFGDKAGLYRAVFMDPRGNPHGDAMLLQTNKTTLDTFLRALLLGFTEPLKQGQVVQSCMKLHFREMVEPTGVWQEEIDTNIKPIHMALVHVLCQHLGLQRADDDVHRLAFSLAGLGIMLHVGGDVFKAIRPGLVSAPKAIDVYAERLLEFAHAMVRAETLRRRKATGV